MEQNIKKKHSLRFVIFKIIYSLLAVQAPDRMTNYFSAIIRNQTTLLNLFDYNYGCDGDKLISDALDNANIFNSC